MLYLWYKFVKRSQPVFYLTQHTRLCFGKICLNLKENFKITLLSLQHQLIYVFDRSHHSSLVDFWDFLEVDRLYWNIIFRIIFIDLLGFIILIGFPNRLIFKTGIILFFYFVIWHWKPTRLFTGLYDLKRGTWITNFFFLTLFSLLRVFIEMSIDLLKGDF